MHHISGAEGKITPRVISASLSQTNSDSHLELFILFYNLFFLFDTFILSCFSWNFHLPIWNLFWSSYVRVTKCRTFLCATPLYTSKFLMETSALSFFFIYLVDSSCLLLIKFVLLSHYNFDLMTREIIFFNLILC